MPVLSKQTLRSVVVVAIVTAVTLIAVPRYLVGGTAQELWQGSFTAQRHLSRIGMSH